MHCVLSAFDRGSDWADLKTHHLESLAFYGYGRNRNGQPYVGYYINSNF